MTEIKPKYKLILHLSDSSTLVFTSSEQELADILNQSEYEGGFYNFDGTIVFLNHILYMQIIDLTSSTTSAIPAKEEETIKGTPYIGSN